MRSQGFSASATSRISAPQAKSTLAVYEGKWKVFVDWCSSHSIDPLQASAPQVADFLLFLFEDKGLLPGTIEGYRTAVAGALRPASGVDLGKDQSLSALIHSFFREKPRSLRTLPPWDLALVLFALSKAPFEPLDSIPLKLLTWKTTFLLLLASGARRGELHAIDHSKVSHAEGWKWVSLEPVPSFLAKTQLRRSGASVLKPFRIPALSSTLPSELVQDRAMCPVRSLKAYLARTRGMRAGKDLLLISYRENHPGDICKNTLSGWIRKLLTMVYSLADKDTAALANLSTHAIRGMAASLAFKGNADMEDLLRACSWKSNNTFISFYLKDMSAVQGELYRLGPLVAAQTVIAPTSRS